VTGRGEYALGSQLRDAERLALAHVALAHSSRGSGAQRAQRLTTRIVLSLSGGASLLALWDLALFVRAGLS
jgi:hypothetical protein